MFQKRAKKGKSAINKVCKQANKRLSKPIVVKYLKAHQARYEADESDTSFGKQHTSYRQ